MTTTKQLEGMTEKTNCQFKTCQICRGMGYDPAPDYRRCRRCGGAGEVEDVHHRFDST